MNIYENWTLQQLNHTLQECSTKDTQSMLEAIIILTRLVIQLQNKVNELKKK